MTTSEGVGECWIIRAGERVGSLSREKPTRWHANGVGGLVRDNEAGWQYGVEIDDRAIQIPEGSDLLTAKRLVRKFALTKATR